MENMIAMLITKRMEIVIGIQVCLYSWMNFDYKENGGNDAFLANAKHQYRVSLYGEHDYHANSKKKKMEITMSIHVYLISRMNFDYTKNGGKKWRKESSSCKSKASISFIPMWKT